MNAPILSIANLTTHLGGAANPVRAVDGVTFDLRRGETFALLGESGCGKSITALSIMRLLPPSGRIVDGAVRLNGADVLGLPEAQMRGVRGAGISMIFQEPMTSLNPVMTVGDQIAESLRTHCGLSGVRLKSRIVELLNDVRMPEPEKRVDEYPHQLSGGMKQRVMIAIALAGQPAVLIADEPTTALDVTIQAQVLQLMRTLQREHGTAILLITHDLGVVFEMADRIAVMYAGELVEQGNRHDFFTAPKHPYSKELFESLPSIHKRNQALHVIQGMVPSLRNRFTGCRFAPRCDWVMGVCRERVPDWHRRADQQVLCHLYAQTGTELSANVVRDRQAARASATHGADRALLEVRELRIYFPILAGLFKRAVGHVRAVDGVDLSIGRGRTLAVVGESGCGKTTVGKGILQLIRPTGGTVRFDGAELTRLQGNALRRLRTQFQIIFQDPFSSMNPRMVVADIIAEGMKSLGVGDSREARTGRIRELLGQVGLSDDGMSRYPHEFSGGQRQRISIARALAVNPKLIVCDEPTSALDVSVQAQILNLLSDLQLEFGLSYLFITHNLSVVAYIAHEVAVMYLGRIVEQGSVEEILNDPKHPYTCALLSAVPEIEPKSGREVIRLVGDAPSPANPPSGCHFHPRCPHRMPECEIHYPVVTRLDQNRMVRCHLYTAIGESA